MYNKFNRLCHMAFRFLDIFLSLLNAITKLIIYNFIINSYTDTIYVYMVVKETALLFFCLLFFKDFYNFF